MIAGHKRHAASHNAITGADPLTAADIGASSIATIQRFRDTVNVNSTTPDVERIYTKVASGGMYPLFIGVQTVPNAGGATAYVVLNNNTASTHISSSTTGGTTTRLWFASWGHPRCGANTDVWSTSPTEDPNNFASAFDLASAAPITRVSVYGNATVGGNFDLTLHVVWWRG